MADSPGKDRMPNAGCPERVTLAVFAARVVRAVDENRILKVKRRFPVIPAEKTVVFTG